MGAKFALALLFLLQVLQLQPLLASGVTDIPDAHVNTNDNADADTAKRNSDSIKGDTSRRSAQSTCTPENAAVKGHTMCLKDDPRVISSGVSALDQETIVYFHNLVRRQVKPPATDLREMVYDPKLAVLAEKLAKQCVLQHDKKEHRTISEYDVFIGQNVAAGHDEWLKAMIGWFLEVKDYRYGENPESYLAPGQTIGHYTQMVNNQAFRIGCGFAECRDSKHGKYYVCNYAAGQLTKSLSHPYTVGERCSACQSNCENGLCGCGGKYCRNRGQIDVDSCKCNCTDVFQGEFCTESKCPPSEPSDCGTDVFVYENCKKYSNLPDICPYTCRVCSHTVYH